MEHLALKATTTTTDTELGQFTALVSAWSTDREGDIIGRHAFDRTIEAWRSSGKQLPLLLNHSTEVVGSIDPASMRPTAEGLVCSGQVDRESEAGAMAWRSIKSGSAGFSIGYKADGFYPLKDGGRGLSEVDLLEVSITSTPMHPSTRALSWKSAEDQNTFREQAAAILNPPESPAAEAKAVKPLRIASFPC